MPGAVNSHSMRPNLFTFFLSEQLGLNEDPKLCRAFTDVSVSIRLFASAKCRPRRLNVFLSGQTEKEDVC